MNRFLLLSMLAATACTAVVGSGTQKEEARQVGEFTGVSVASGISATVTVGPATSVVVSGDDNIVPLILTTVEGGELQIAPEDHASLLPREPMLVTVTLPALDSVSTSGGATLCATGVAADDFTASASGGSTITVAGTAASLVADASGGSHLHLQGLVAATAHLSASGGSQIDADATASAEADASGGSKIGIAGGGTIQPSTSGGSSVDAQ